MIEELRKHIVKLKNTPYAILMNDENFRVLSTECNIGSALVWLPNYKSVYGIPIIIDEEYPLKAVTEDEFRNIYKAS